MYSQSSFNFFPVLIMNEMLPNPIFFGRLADNLKSQVTKTEVIVLSSDSSCTAEDSGSETRSRSSSIHSIVI